MWRDLERTCDALGIPFRRPSQFPRNGILSARVACHFADAPWLPAFVRAIYTANFAGDLDIADSGVIGACIADLGESAEQVLQQAQSVQSKNSLREQTDTAMRMGIFGAPTVVAAGELFWGNDRLEEALEWAVKHGDPG
jgi:2-hydroxychromene-2-carboxylate isomerase